MLHITSAKRCHCQFPITSAAEGAFIPSFTILTHTKASYQPCKKKGPRRHAKLGTANDVQLTLPFSLPRPHITQRKPYHTNGTRRGSRSDQRGKGLHPVALESPRCAPKGGTTTRLKRGGPSYNLQASSVTLARNVISRLRRRNGRGIRNKSTPAVQGRYSCGLLVNIVAPRNMYWILNGASAIAPASVSATVALVKPRAA